MATGDVQQVSLGGTQATQNGAARTSTVPPVGTTIVAGTVAATAAQAATNIAANMVAANSVFQGVVTISAAASAAIGSALGTLRVAVNWVSGSGGTASQVVAAVDLTLAATTAGTTGNNDSGQVSIPIVVYAGTTAGTFQVGSFVTGIITTQIWDVFVNGIVST